MSASQQASKNADDIVAVLPVIGDKFVVDFANGIHVVRDHLCVQHQRSGLFARLCDCYTGKGAKRQVEINACLVDGVEASLKWLSELSESLAHSNYAIVRVNDRLNDLKQDVAKIAHYSADTREQLNALAEHLAERCNSIEHEIARIDFIQRVQINLDTVFHKWGAGHYRSLSLAGRCYAALEELHWGDFGDYYRSGAKPEDKKKFVDILKNRVIIQLNTDSKYDSTDRIETRHWLNYPTSQDHWSDMRGALIYLADTTNEVQQPFVYSTAQNPQHLPLRMPCLCSAERLGVAMLGEVFGVRRTHV